MKNDTIKYIITGERRYSADILLQMLCHNDALNDVSFVNVMHGPSEESDSNF